MTSSVYFRIVALILLATGIAALLLPDMYASIAGTDATQGAMLWIRFFAAAKLGYGVALWAVSGAASSIKRVAAWSIVLAFGLDIVLDIAAVSTGQMDTIGLAAAAVDVAIIAGAFWVVRSPDE